MPAIVKILTPDGLQDVPYTADSLADAAKYETHDGVYTITNTYNAFQVLKLASHLDRLEDSARREGIGIQLDRGALRAALRNMISESGFGDVRFRITVPRETPDHLILSIEPFTPQPPEVYTAGVRCITVADAARHNPAAKTLDWVHDRETVSLRPGIYTGLLLDSEGNILEGLSSNFYAVLNGELHTAGAGVLPGIAQQIVFTVAPDVLPLRKDAVSINDLGRLQEAFVTSSSRGIVPVIEIDGITIGDGKPGAKTVQLRERYQQWVEQHLEDL
jgi:branched-chain amino acid aminotransferase